MKKKTKRECGKKPKANKWKHSKRSTRVWQKLKITHEHNKTSRKLKEKKNYLINDCSIHSRANESCAEAQRRKEENSKYFSVLQQLKYMRIFQSLSR